MLFELPDRVDGRRVGRGALMIVAANRTWQLIAPFVQWKIARMTRTLDYGASISLASAGAGVSGAADAPSGPAPAPLSYGVLVLLALFLILALLYSPRWFLRV